MRHLRDDFKQFILSYSTNRYIYRTIHVFIVLSYVGNPVRKKLNFEISKVYDNELNRILGILNQTMLQELSSIYIYLKPLTLYHHVLAVNHGLLSFSTHFSKTDFFKI